MKPRAGSCEEFDLESCMVEFSIRPIDLMESPEDDDLLVKFDGKIKIYDGEGGDVQVGKIAGTRISVGDSMERACRLWQVCDADSQDLHDLYVAFCYFDTGEYREVLKLQSFGDLLAVTSIEIKEGYRGFNLGLLAMLRTIMVMGAGCAVVGIKPFPIQYSTNVTPQNAKEFGKAQGKLRAYWQRLGFLRVGRSDYYYLDMALRLPKPESLAKRKSGARTKDRAAGQTAK